eukprot:1161966-Pelagomonas_calceolata.AAC.10
MQGDVETASHHAKVGVMEDGPTKPFQNSEALLLMVHGEVETAPHHTKVGGEKGYCRKEACKVGLLVSASQPGI